MQKKCIYRFNLCFFRAARNWNTKSQCALIGTSIVYSAFDSSRLRFQSKTESNKPKVYSVIPVIREVWGLSFEAEDFEELE